MLRLTLNYFCKQFKMKNKPIIVVGGCTGTGKSDLGIEIAKKFNGEIISADSMQIYKGLDIVTNKVTDEEMGGVPHHLMSFYNPVGSKYNVSRFQQEALDIIKDIWNRDKLPVIVGGTAYYVEAVIFSDNLITAAKADAKQIRERLEKLNTNELYSRLQEVDPVYAAQVHRNNRFRVMRAVEIFELTGKPKSEHIASVGSMDTGLRFPKTLMFHLDSDPSVLDDRLSKRIDKMIARGLRTELEEFYDTHESKLLDHGVLQSIGIKEYLSYLALSADERKSNVGESLFARGNADLTLHTVQYAKKQRLWFRQRFLKRKLTRELPTLVAVDTTAASSFFTEIVPEALKVVSSFLDNKPLNFDNFNTSYVSDPFASIDNASIIAEPDYAKRSNAIHICNVCDMEIHGEKGWKTHLAGKKHNHFAKKRKFDVKS